MGHLRGSIYFWLLAVANAVSFQGTILVLALKAPPAAVAVYATHRTASGLIGYIAALLQAPLWPELTFLDSQGRRTDLARTSLLAVKVVGAVSSAAAVALAALLPVIYPLWTGRRLQFNAALLAAFLIHAVLSAGWMTSGWSLLAANQHRRPALCSIANALLTIGLSVFMVGRWGVLGVAWAVLAAGVVCGALVYPLLASRHLGVPVSRIYLAVSLPVLALLPLVLAPLLPGLTELVRISLLGGVGLILAGAVARLMFGEADELSWLLGKFRRAPIRRS